MSSRAAALCLPSLCFHGGLCGPLSVTVLHLNDHHSHLEDTTFDLDLSAVSGLSSSPVRGALQVRYGGFPMLASLAKALSADSEAVLKVHAGDAITGTAYYSTFKGQADAAMMNGLCFDTFTLGNHEFDDGDAVLSDFLDALHANSTACNTSVLSANVVPGQLSPLRGKVAPWAIKSFGGDAVAVVGITTRRKTTESSSPSHGTVLEDEAQAAQRAIDELVSLGHDKIVLATHIGYGQDVQLARRLRGVDVVIGGDSHELMGSREGVGLIKVPGVPSYPVLTEDLDGSPVCVAQAWEYAHLLGVLRVQFDESGLVANCTGAPAVPFAPPLSLEAGDRALVTSFLEATGEFQAVEPDATMQQTLAVFQSEVEVLKQSIVGRASATLCVERVPGGGRSTMCHPSDTWEHGSQIGQVVARAFLTVTHTADIAIQNAGGVRADLPAGNVSIDDCITVLPFSNTLVVAQMTGAQIKSSIEDALANFIDGESDGSYPIASGLRFRVDASKARGSRVSRLQANPKMSSFWEDISATRTYSVVTNSYIASGKDGYATFGSLSFENTFTEYAQALINHVEQVGVVHEPSASDYSTQVYVDVMGCNHSAVPYGGCPRATVDSGTIALSMSRLLRAALAAALGLETLRLW